MSIETAAILDEAANVIRRNGWFQGDYYDRTRVAERGTPSGCPVCARGGINVALGGEPTDDYMLGGQEASDAVMTWLWNAGCLGERYSLADWNDDPNRTPEDVIAALESAARAEREAAS